jgi:ketosteroid isomerase-like protein
MAQSEDSIESRNEAIVKASFVAWASGARSPYDVLADDASWSIVGHSVASKTYPSKEAFLREVIRPFNVRMSGREAYHPHLRRGRHRHRLLRMENGKVVKASAFFDSIVFNDFWQRVQPDPSKSRKE